MNVIDAVINLISCTILVLVMRLAHIKTKSVVVGGANVERRNKINKMVTLSHITVTIAFTASQVILNFNTYFGNTIQYYRMMSAFYFFGAVADLFLSVMIWFILDDQK